MFSVVFPQGRVVSYTAFMVVALLQNPGENPGQKSGQKSTAKYKERERERETDWYGEIPYTVYTL